MAFLFTKAKSLIPQWFLAEPTDAQKAIPDQSGKVHLVTGGNTGVGKEVARILYSRNARVYVAGRSGDKSRAAVEEIRAAFPDSSGVIDYIHLDLSDLDTIPETARAFLARETRLDALINNAGVGFPSTIVPTKQGFEQQFGVNAIGHFALVQLLTPVLRETAAAGGPAPRVVWVSSSGAELGTVAGLMKSLPRFKELTRVYQYLYSKVGNYLHAVEYANRERGNGIISLTVNPGDLDSDLWRGIPWIFYIPMRVTVLFPSEYGAITELFAACSPEVTLDKSGSHIAPWGRFWSEKLSQDMKDATRTEEQGGSGIARDFWKWTEEAIEPFVPKSLGK